MFAVEYVWMLLIAVSTIENVNAVPGISGMPGLCRCQMTHKPNAPVESLFTATSHFVCNSFPDHRTPLCYNSNHPNPLSSYASELKCSPECLEEAKKRGDRQFSLGFIPRPVFDVEKLLPKIEKIVNEVVDVESLKKEIESLANGDHAIYEEIMKTIKGLPGVARRFGDAIFGNDHTESPQTNPSYRFEDQRQSEKCDCTANAPRSFRHFQLYGVTFWGCDDGMQNKCEPFTKITYTDNRTGARKTMTSNEWTLKGHAYMNQGDMRSNYQLWSSGHTTEFPIKCGEKVKIEVWESDPQTIWGDPDDYVGTFEIEDICQDPCALSQKFKGNCHESDSCNKFELQYHVC